MTHYGMVINLATCTRCRACIVACKTEHQIPTGDHKGHEYYRIRVLEFEEGVFPQVKRIFAPILCVQCENAPCIDVCPIPDALQRREDKIIVVEGDKCTGCKRCLQVCPYNALYLDEEKRIVDKCDFCANRVDEKMEPACVAACMNHAILFGDLDDPNSPISKMRTHPQTTPNRPLWPRYFTAIFKPSVYYTSTTEKVTESRADN